MRTLRTIIVAGTLLTGVTVTAEGRYEGDDGDQKITTGEFQISDMGNDDEAGRKVFGSVLPQISGKPFCRPAFRITPARRCLLSRHPRTRDDWNKDDDRSGGHERSKVCIDLNRDVDGDGLPDELLAAIDNIRDLPPSGQTAAIVDLVSRLPYSQATLNLQAEAAVATLQLEQCDPSAPLRDQLATKLQDLLDAMTADPQYTKAQKSIQEILARDFAFQFPAPPQSGGPACELTQTSTGPTCVGFNLTTGQSCALKTVTTGTTICELETPPNPPVPPPNGVHWSSLSPGDLILRRSSSPIWRTLDRIAYSIFYTHAAMWNGDRFFYESIEKGVVLTAFDDWIKESDQVAIGYNVPSPGLQEIALSLVEKRYGTDGRTNSDFGRHFDKESDSHGVYCSQLAWKMMKIVGVDIDSQDWRVALGLAARWGVIGGIFGIPNPFSAAFGLYVARVAVFPDEIFWSRDMYWYYIGNLPSAD
jgi:hypothetical protein